MRQIIKFDLEFEPTLEYVKDNLDKTNVLSSELIKLTNFSEGKFFTFLPSAIEEKRLHKFTEGLVLPQDAKPLIKQAFDPNVSARDATAVFIVKAQLEKRLYSVFDDVIQAPTDPHLSEVFYKHGICYNAEIYYVVKAVDSSNDLIKKCLQESNGLWHSLCLLTRSNLADKMDKVFSLEEIQDICLKTEIAIIGAYDAEGYVIWEKANMGLEM